LTGDGSSGVSSGGNATRGQKAILWAAGGLAALLLAAAGCAVAPLAFQLVEAVGVEGIQVAAETAAIEHGDKPPKDPQEFQRLCDELALETPMILEVHRDAFGTISYREMTLQQGVNSSNWVVVQDQYAGADGWRAGADLAQMDFSPPISSDPSTRIYIAFELAAPKGEDVQEPGDQLVDNQYQQSAVSTGPNQKIGHFRWNGQSYDYAVIAQLPCFDGPPG
jgi:hypothetical protein